ncbi:MAG TPA: hypothetical protein ENN55_03985 [Firmicutes bacterium]|nr:hypothetical protein [Bacillota bacterium]
MADNNIGGINSIAAQNILDMGANKNASQNVNNERTEGGAVGDRVEISERAEAISRALNAVNNMAKIREDAVSKAIINKIQENQRTPAEILSAKLLIED